MNVYQKVTDCIIEMLQAGVCPWKKTWKSKNQLAINYESRKPYSLLNQFLLGQSGEYLTFTQIHKLGGHIRKGAKAKFVVFFKFIYKDENGNNVKENDISREDIDKIQRIPYLTYYNVYHLSDCEGIESKIVLEPTTLSDDDKVLTAETAFENYVRQSGVKFNDDGSMACYKIQQDTICVPNITLFEDVNEYYSTLFHECIHSTGHESRLNRKMTARTSRDSYDYSKEELIAEIGNVMLLSEFGLDSKPVTENSAGYIDGWIKALKSDERMIVVASSQAEKAAKYFLGETPAS